MTAVPTLAIPENDQRTMQKPYLILAIAVMLSTGCNRSEKPQPAEVIRKPRITADLIRDPSGTNAGVVRLTGDLGDVSNGEVYVSINGGEEKRVFTIRNSQEWPWVRVGRTNEFRLYRGTNHTELLNSATVMKSK